MNIIVMPTDYCNASCRYCFVKPRRGNVTINTQKRIFREVLRYAKDHSIKKVYFFWQGGEAMLLGPDWYFRMKEICDGIFSRADVTVVHNIQTNLLCFSREWVKVISEVFQGQVSSTIDFPNQHRILSGNDSGDRYEKLWTRKYHSCLDSGVRVNVISMLTRATIGTNPEEYFSYYRNSLGLSSWQVNFLHSGADEKINREILYLPSDELSDFLCRLSDILMVHPGIGIEPIGGLINRIRSTSQGLVPCIFSLCCASTFFSIGSDGTVSNCDCWVGKDDSMSFGNILGSTLDEIALSPKRGAFFDRPARLLAGECGACPFLALCFGGCPVSVEENQDGIFRPDSYCRVFRSLFDHLLQQGGTWNGLKLRNGQLI